jgi:hypothetical protein
VEDPKKKTAYAKGDIDALAIVCALVVLTLYGYKLLGEYKDRPDILLLDLRRFRSKAWDARGVCE